MDAKDIFFKAIEIESTDDRRAFIDSACGDDPSLRKRVEALLAAHDDPDSYLAKPAAKFDVTQSLAAGAGGSNLSDSSVHGRFLPGTKVADRYRIVSLLGRGGMGEVYRADDLRLDQPVALKFLPTELAKDQKRLDYFHNEVKLARQISHPNVCRVYDIGEVNGQHFISMEYIDGEDLKTLLTRIGRLPKDKGTEIAQQLCAGLSAAHSNGVLHRDLKPANIMIDGQGRARVTDFGLATVETGSSNVIGMSGTPAYMAPEQLLRGETSVQSDIYSLGLILYEVFTGKPTHAAASLAELRKVHENDSQPERPSALVEDMDPVVEAAIARCLNSDPAERPTSTSQVAASLPGGDPLAAVLAAGEIPSPELLAATTGEFEGLSIRTVLMLLSGILVGLVAYVFLCQRASNINQYRMTRAPNLLADDSAELLEGMGIEVPEHRRYGFSPGVEGGLSSAFGGDSIIFWFRASPSELVATDMVTIQHRYGNRVDPINPAWTNRMVGVQLNELGKLVWFRREVPPRLVEQRESFPEIDWVKQFPAELTGVDLSTLKRETSKQLPDSIQCDTAFVWKGTDEQGRAVRVVAAALHGQPCYFELITPRAFSKLPKWIGELVAFVIFVLIFGQLICTTVLAIRYLRKRRTDRRGVVPLVVMGFLSGLVTVISRPNHSSDADQEFWMLLYGTAMAVLVGCFYWLTYCAVEPFCRRRLPHLLISWTRLIRGQWRDARLGKEFLLGIAAQLAVSCYWMLIYGFLLDRPSRVDLRLLMGGSEVLFHFSQYFHVIMLLHFIYLFQYVSIWWISRSHVVATTIVGILMASIYCGSDSLPVHLWPIVGGVFLVLIGCMGRYGFAWFFAAGLTVTCLKLPITADTQAFYFSTGILGPILVAIFACYASFIATGNKLKLDF